MIKLLILIIVTLTTFPYALAQVPDGSSVAGGREAMMEFAELNNKQMLKSNEARLLLTGEASEWRNAWFGRISNQPDKLVLVEKNFAVAGVETIGKDSRVVDLYFYLKFDNGWKIRSMRAMAQTWLLEAVNTELKTKAILTATEKGALANTELVLSSDKMLAEWFQKNRSALDKLVAVTIVETKKKPKKTVFPVRRRVRVGTSWISQAIGNSVNEDSENEPRTIDYVTANIRKFPRSAAALKNLHVRAMETKSNGNIEIIIGGILDNSVGFVYSPSETPPPIDGWRYIWVEKVAAGWYLFRTT